MPRGQFPFLLWRREFGREFLQRELCVLSLRASSAADVPPSPPLEERVGERRPFSLPCRGVVVGKAAVHLVSTCGHWYRAARELHPNARRLRRQQTREEKQLWRALRAGHLAGFEFRRQHPLGGYTLDFYCPLARLSVELDGIAHGLPQQIAADVEREKLLLAHDIEELRFWKRQWRQNRDGVLLEIWHAVQRRTGCTQVMRKVENQTFVPPPLQQLGQKPARKPPWETRHTTGRGM